MKELETAWNFDQAAQAAQPAPRVESQPLLLSELAQQQHISLLKQQELLQERLSTLAQQGAMPTASGKTSAEIIGLNQIISGLESEKERLLKFNGTPSERFANVTAAGAAKA